MNNVHKKRKNGLRTGREANELKARVDERIGKSVMQLTSREASKLTDGLKAA